MLIRVIKYHYHPPLDRRDSRRNACYESQFNVPLSYPCPGNILCQSKDGTQAHSEQWCFSSRCSIRLISTEIAAWGGPPGAVPSFSHTLVGERDVVFHPTPPAVGPEETSSDCSQKDYYIDAVFTLRSPQITVLACLSFITSVIKITLSFHHVIRALSLPSQTSLVISTVQTWLLSLQSL